MRPTLPVSRGLFAPQSPNPATGGASKSCEKLHAALRFSGPTAGNFERTLRSPVRSAAATAAVLVRPGPKLAEPVQRVLLEKRFFSNH
jgi:hypothetical protein